MWLSKIYYLYQILPAILFVFYNNFRALPLKSTYPNNISEAMRAKTHVFHPHCYRYITDSELEKIFKGYGLVDVKTLDSTIVVDLRYASNYNFLGRNLYGEIHKAYLQKDVAIKLAKASQLLRSEHASLRIVVLDAARPLSIQQQMWTDVNLPNGNKEKFVASPYIGSLHNYGAAVDVTLCNQNGIYLDMGTSFDSFSDTAYTINEEDLLRVGKLTQTQYQNRKLLRKIMTAAGFYPIETEWWHFNACSRNYARTHYPIIVSHIYADNPLLISKAKEVPVLTDISMLKVEFRIQILTSINAYSSKDSRFKRLKVDWYKQDNLYKYTTGHYTNLEKALADLELIKKKGFNDAFIVAFNNKHERISIKDAVELLHSKD